MPGMLFDRTNDWVGPDQMNWRLVEISPDLEAPAPEGHVRTEVRRRRTGTLVVACCLLALEPIASDAGAQEIAMNVAKYASVSTCDLRRRINRALAHSRRSLWFSNRSVRGPYMIVAGNTVQATGIVDLEALARELGVMQDWEVWSERVPRH